MPIPGRKPRTVAKTQHTGYYRGEEGRQRAEAELVKAKAKAEARRETGNQPFRYRISPGETGSFVILDDEPNFYRFEHNLQNPHTGFFDLFVGCCAEWDNCPADSKGDPYYGLFMSIIDLVPYTNKQNVTTEFSRKLLVVKPAQQKKFIRAYQRAMKEYGTMRGVVFETTRDGKMDSAIGNDIEMTDEFIEEDDLQTYIRTWKDRENKKHVENCFEVFDYEALFPPPTPESISAALGEGPQPGTRAHEDKVLGRGTARRRAAPVDDDADEDEEPEAPPARRGSYQKPGTTGRMSTRRRAEPEEEEVDEEQEDDTPVSRARARTSRSAEAPARKTAPAPARRRAAPVDEEVEDEEEAPPRRTTVRKGVPPRSAGRQAATATRSNPVRRRAVDTQYEDEEEDIPF